MRAGLATQDLSAVLRNLWVYEIQGQDDAGAWIAGNFPEIHYMRNQVAWRGISYHIRHEWFETRGDQEELVSPDWFRENIQEGHGALGCVYPSARYLHEGDTPSILHLIPNGLHDPFQLEQGGWGGRFDSVRRRNVWSGGCPVTDEHRFGEFEMYSDAADTCTWTFWNHRPTCNVYNPILRWREAVQHDFAARMDWCVCTPEEANHSPKAVVNGDETRNILQITAQPGESIRFDASASMDPDGDALHYHWWIYPEPGSRNDADRIQQEHAPIATLHLSPTVPSGEVHVILTLTDNGTPPLTAYRRIIVYCEGAKT